MSKTVLGVVHSRAAAGNLIGRLASAGFLLSNVSVLYLGEDRSKSAVVHAGPALETSTPPIASSFGLLVGLGAVTIPGVGGLIGAGPVLAELGGPRGATLGSLSAGLLGMGVGPNEAVRYDAALRAGSVLIGARAVDRNEIDRAKRLMETLSVSDVSVARHRPDPGTPPAWN